MTVTVQPLASKDAFAAKPAGPGDEDVPPSKLTIPFDCPAVSSEIKILSTLVLVKPQLSQAKVKSVAEHVLNMLAGKVANCVQLYQDDTKLVPLLRLRAGKEVRPEQLIQALPKSVPLLVFIRGNEVSPVQTNQARLKLVTWLVSISGKEVRLVQSPQADSKEVAEPVLRRGKVVKLSQ